jgi:hypothetical protein
MPFFKGVIFIAHTKLVEGYCEVGLGNPFAALKSHHWLRFGGVASSTFSFGNFWKTQSKLMAYFIS